MGGKTLSLFSPLLERLLELLRWLKRLKIGHEKEVQLKFG
jgi:hypothetical protein